MQMQANGEPLNIGEMRRESARIEHAYQLAQVKLKLIRSLKTQLTESQ